MEYYSNALRELLETKTGYRNDDYSTGNYHIKDVIDFEVDELGNTDIFETCEKLYSTSKVYDVISKHFPNVSLDKLWGLWLTTLQGTIEHYKGEEEGYNIYSIPDNALVISDINHEGVLFVLDVHPNTLIKEEIR